MSTMHAGHIEIFVSDPIAAKDFYTDVLEFDVFAIQNKQFVWLKSGHLEVLLRPGTPHTTPTYQKTSHGIVLYTDDLEKKRNELAERGLTFKGTDGADTCLTFTDPDGNWFQLVNPNHT